MQRLLPNTLGMLYHAELYKRMIDFAKANTPEFPCEPVVRKWLDRFYSGDNNIHIIISTNDDGALTGHAVVDVQESYGIRAVLCHQAAHDKVNGDSVYKGMAEAIEYVDKLRDTTDAACSMITVGKNSKVYEKKYGYKTLRTVMIKVSGELEEDNGKDI